MFKFGTAKLAGLAITINEGKVIRLPADGCTITCVDGTAWITQEGQGFDYVLSRPRKQ